MSSLVVVRHGQSVWNKQNRFTGWVDVGLTAQGAEDARAAGRRLRGGNTAFSCACTSALKRAILTLNLMLEEMDKLWLPTIKDARFNERHYGALQGRIKSEAARECGEEQVRAWRRDFLPRPPPLKSGNVEDDGRYAGAPIPEAESLKDATARVAAAFAEHIAPRLSRGENVLLVAHGNSLRALIKHLAEVPDDQAADIRIAHAAPLRLEFNSAGKLTGQEKI